MHSEKLDFLEIDTVIENIQNLVNTSNITELKKELKTLHSADLAEHAGKFKILDLVFITENLSNKKAANFFSELDEDIRKELLDELNYKEISEFLSEMDTDDGADLLDDLDEDKKVKVLNYIEDKEHVSELKELATYEKGTAGALMAKEYISVRENWTIDECLKEVRRQALEVSKVHSLYIIDNVGRLIGRISLKDLISAPYTKKVSDLRSRRVDSVTTSTTDVEVAYTMEKYNMEAIPVTDEEGILLGRITIDDVIDIVRDKAEENYNLASGITDEIEEDDGIMQVIKARLPWLIIALIGGFLSITILSDFGGPAMEQHKQLFYFTPLIAAMAGNVGVQSSAIVVQALANGSFKGGFWKRFIKETSVSLLNGLFLAAMLFAYGFFFFQFSGADIILTLTTVCISLVSVIVIASIVGTFVPLILNKFGINPAMATGPFITTSNDIFGIVIFFSIAKIILGF